MKRVPDSVLIILLLVGITGFTNAYSQEDTVSDLKTKYETAVTQLNEKYKTEKEDLKNKFLNAWLKSEKSLQQAGDLNGFLASKNERENFMKNGTLGSEGPQAIQSLREVYNTSLASIEEKETKARGSIEYTYYKALENVAIELTKANKIEEAIAVNKLVDERKKIVLGEAPSKTEGEMAKDSPVEKPTKSDDEIDMTTFLVGKTFTFQREDLDHETHFSFQADGAALWLGRKNQAVERAYRPTDKPRQIFLWWPARGEKYYPMLLTVGDDPDTAELYEKAYNRTSKGRLTKTR